jgi:predicted AlkP superfamily phosphohydrolase/phosphomutase
MKLLTIGIDGGTKKIIEDMPMPFTQNLFSNSNFRELDEDLISRGWAEILTGENAPQNKAFYLAPCADGSYNFSYSYSKSDMVSASSSTPLWERLNELGVSVGLLNIPTTGPADQVNGFIVAGGGGGLKAGGPIPAGMVYPENFESVLKKNNYIFDIRLPGGTHTASEFLKKITAAEENQKNTFIELAKKVRPKFGFHCFRMTTEIQYLARYEIELLAENIKKSREKSIEFRPAKEIQKFLINHFKQLDNHIRNIFEELKPESYIFIGDHSTALFKHEGNIDVWLAREGYLSRMSKKRLFMSRASNFLKKKSKSFLRSTNLTEKSRKMAFRNPITRFSKSKTSAFGTFYEIGNFAGIFINDKERFGGPVKSEVTAKQLVNDICSKLNSDPTAISYGLKANPYRENFQNSAFQKFMPDIKIDKSDTIYFSGRRWEFIVNNPNLKPLDESLSEIRYPHSGVKGRDPLFVYSKNLENLFSDNDPNDLRVAYRLICRFFDHQKKHG